MDGRAGADRAAQLLGSKQYARALGLRVSIRTEHKSNHSRHLHRPSLQVGANLTSIIDKFFELHGDEEEVLATMESIRDG